jgi:solute carrier family 25 protein 38
MLNSKFPDVNRTLVNVISGTSGGFAATIATHPFDVIKTKIQLDPNEYRNMVYGMKRVWMVDGLSGFFRGVAPRAVKKSISSAIAWTVYEEIISLYSKIK